MNEMVLAAVLKKIFAIAVFVWLAFTFYVESRAKNRNWCAWVMIGMASFYGSYFIVAAGISAVRLFVAIHVAGGFDRIPPDETAWIVASSIVLTIPFAFAVALIVRQRLRNLPHLLA